MSYQFTQKLLDTLSKMEHVYVGHMMDNGEQEDYIKDKVKDIALIREDLQHLKNIRNQIEIKN